MNARLIKETRDLLPMFAGTLPLIVVPQLIWPPAGFGYLALGVACAVMAGSLLARSSSTGPSRCCSHNPSPDRWSGATR